MDMYAIVIFHANLSNTPFYLFRSRPSSDADIDFVQWITYSEPISHQFNTTLIYDHLRRYKLRACVPKSCPSASSSGVPISRMPPAANIFDGPLCYHYKQSLFFTELKNQTKTLYS